MRSMCKARRATVAAVGVRFTRHDNKVFDRGRSLERLGGDVRAQTVKIRLSWLWAKGTPSSSYFCHKEPCENGREAVLGCSSVRPHGREIKTLGFHMLKKKKKNQGKEKEKLVNETVKEITK